MKETVFNVDGRFMRFIRWINDNGSWYYTRREWDTCSLTKHVLVTLLQGFVKLMGFCFILGGLLGIGLIVGGSVLEKVFDIPVSNPYMQAVSIFVGAVTVVVLVVVIASGIAGCIWLRTKYDKWTLQVPDENPGAVAVLYRNWKEKTCSKITFK